MSKKNAGAKAGTKKNGSAFRIIFLVLFIVLVILGIFLVKPLFDLTIGNAAEPLGSFASFATVHFTRLFDFESALKSNSEMAFYTGIIEWYMVLAVAVVLIFFIFFPLHLMRKLKKQGKKHMGVRRVFLILSFLLALASAAFGTMFVLRNYLGDFGKTLASLYAKVFDRFDPILGKNTLIRLGGAISSHAGFFLWLILAMFVVFLVIDLLCCIGKKHEVKAKNAQKATKNEDTEITEDVETIADSREQPEEGILIGALAQGPLSKESEDVNIGAVEKEAPSADELAQADKDLKALDEPLVERIVPTRHDLAILNTLEPFHTERVEKLPGMYPEQTENSIASLEPTNEDSHKASKEGENGNPNILPGIDEYGADPWLDAPVEEDSPLSGLSEAPSAKEDITSEVAPEEETTSYVDEVVPVEEPVEEQPVAEEEPIPEEEPIAEEETVEPEVIPVEEEVVPVEEEVVPVEEEPAEEPAEEVVEEQPVEEPVEEQPAEEEVVDEEHQKLLEEEAKKAETPLADNEWNAGEYDPEAEAAKKAAEEEAAKKAAEEEAARKAAEEEAARKAAEEEAAKKAAEEEAARKAAEEEAAKKPVASVKKMEPLTPSHLNNGPKPTAIKPIAPVKQEEAPVEEVQEEKKIAPISGPMHTINKPIDKSAIKPVEAKHVAFDLKRYQVKTYKGSLTAEEAFQKGVTKVQPTVQPTFNNANGKEASWKEKRRKEEIRKNGYQNVSTVQDLTPIQKPTEIKADTEKAGSIRDLVKANKAAEEAKAQNDAKTPEAKEAEAKPVKPIAPIKPVAPVKKEETPATEEKPEEKPIVKPIAPIHKPAPTNRPKPTAIKPVKPVSVKKQ